MSLPDQVNRELFEDAANQFGTDKSRIHGYHRFYPQALSGVGRSDEFTIIEIGYGEGQSLPMWRRLFPNAFITCIDKNIEKEGDGFVVLKADQNNPSSLVAALNDVPKPVRLIVDDGSHHPQHQLTTFSTLFTDYLEAGGCYVIEDIETSYWLAGELYGNQMRFGLFSPWSAVEAFKIAGDYTNRCFLSEADRNLLEYSMSLVGLTPEAASLINSISFGQNCISVIKCVEADAPYLERKYANSAFTARH